MFQGKIFNRGFEVIILILICAYASQGAERRFELELGAKIGGNKKVVERYWKPRSLEVEQGDRVTIDLKNSKTLLAGNVTFSLDGYPSAWTKVKMGKNATAAFTADKIGEFRFNCNVPGCSAGILTVKPPRASPQQVLVPPADQPAIAPSAPIEPAPIPEPPGPPPSAPAPIEPAAPPTPPPAPIVSFPQNNAADILDTHYRRFTLTISLKETHENTQAFDKTYNEVLRKFRTAQTAESSAWKTGDRRLFAATQGLENEGMLFILAGQRKRLLSLVNIEQAENEEKIRYERYLSLRHDPDYLYAYLSKKIPSVWTAPIVDDRVALEPAQPPVVSPPKPPPEAPAPLLDMPAAPPAAPITADLHIYFKPSTNPSDAPGGKITNGMAFYPMKLEALQGQDVQITVHNQSSKKMAFLLPDFINFFADPGKVPAGENRAFSFKANKTGSFSYSLNEAGLLAMAKLNVGQLTIKENPNLPPTPKIYAIELLPIESEFTLAKDEQKTIKVQLLNPNQERAVDVRVRVEADGALPDGVTVDQAIKIGDITEGASLSGFVNVKAGAGYAPGPFRLIVKAIAANCQDSVAQILLANGATMDEDSKQVYFTRTLPPLRIQVSGNVDVAPGEEKEIKLSLENRAYLIAVDAQLAIQADGQAAGFAFDPIVAVGSVNPVEQKFVSYKVKADAGLGDGQSVSLKISAKAANSADGLPQTLVVKVKSAAAAAPPPDAGPIAIPPPAQTQPPAASANIVILDRPDSHIPIRMTKRQKPACWAMVKNMGSETIRGVTASFESTRLDISTVDPGAVLGDIAPGESRPGNFTMTNINTGPAAVVITIKDGGGKIVATKSFAIDTKNTKRGRKNLEW
ncbi:MAG: hypothetical protein HY747_00695 [Elusimicrobia bacterium]|nr:hypothetical protein [Elusimicrobiota bacterium]